MNTKSNKNNNNEFIVRFNNQFYDISQFYHKHPGGINTLKGLANTDMTQRFNKGPAHSKNAMYLLNEYRIQDNNHNTTTTTTILPNQNLQEISNKNGYTNTNHHDSDNQVIDESMEHIVDWSKPMLNQISNIIDEYDIWVHKPVDRTLRLFGPWYLEMLTKTPWWILPVCWMPSIIYLVYSEAFLMTTHKHLELSDISLYFIVGIIIWTFLEYILHRFVFHMNVSKSNTGLCTFHFLMHGLHHKVPFDAYRLVFPPIGAAILASIFYIPIQLIFSYPRIILGGGLLGYLIYDLTHYYLHYGNPKIWHFYQMKRYHYQHHFTNHNLGFGVSSPFWDYVFRSQIYLRNLKQMLRW